MNKQTFTSANTSVNSKSVPAAFRRFQPFGKVLDYGCGRFWSLNEKYCIDRKATAYIPYDPYNCNCGVSRETVENMNDIDTAYCCNVLNVIDSDDVVKDVIRTVCSTLKVGGIAYFQIYEGNRSGLGSVTKKDCYQRNERLHSYFLLFHEALSLEFYIQKSYNCYVVTRNI